MHSKTPWVPVHNGYYWEVRVPFEDDTEIYDYSPSVASVWNVGEDTAAYNARLMAAAPDLLKSLKELLASRHSSLDIVAAVKAQQAINKAEGK